MFGHFDFVVPCTFAFHKFVLLVHVHVDHYDINAEDTSDIV